jgi:hypothetical protein
MYVDILSSVLDRWDTDLNGSALLDYAIECRSNLLNSGTSEDACGLLAAEIAYDRALIRLCDEVGIEATATGFVDPYAERARVEDNLASIAGIDLLSLSKLRSSIF